MTAAKPTSKDVIHVTTTLVVRWIGEKDKISKSCKKYMTQSLLSGGLTYNNALSCSAWKQPAIERLDSCCNASYSYFDFPNDLACRDWSTIEIFIWLEAVPSWNPQSSDTGVLFLSADVLVSK
jgi:hypothetical protein